jgi:hypothetical protein
VAAGIADDEGRDAAHGIAEVVLAGPGAGGNRGRVAAGAGNRSAAAIATKSENVAADKQAVIALPRRRRRGWWIGGRLLG